MPREAALNEKARRDDLQARVAEILASIDVDAPTEADAKLDLGSVLVSFGLALVRDALGTPSTARHLARLAAEWRLKVLRERPAAPPQSTSRELH